MLRSKTSWAACLGLARQCIRGVLGPEQALTRGVATVATKANGGEPSRERGAPPLEARKFEEGSKRTGVIAVKMGMTQDWDSYGAFVPLTVLWIDDCHVTQVKRKEIDGVTSLQLGVGSKKMHKSQPRHSKDGAAGSWAYKRKLAEFRVSEDGLLPEGTPVIAAHFNAGQFVDVTGTTVGKGFQGVMKRWGFKGGSASHGTSLAHRTPGSTGACQDPGKVWKGKKLPGHMGAVQRTVHNCWVHKVDPQRNLLYIKGQVPGHRGNFVLVRDAVRKSQTGLPFPTYIGEIQPPSTADPLMDPYHLYSDKSS